MLYSSNLLNMININKVLALKFFSLPRMQNLILVVCKKYMAFSSILYHKDWTQQLRFNN